MYDSTRKYTYMLVFQRGKQKKRLISGNFANKYGNLELETLEKRF